MNNQKLTEGWEDKDDSKLSQVERHRMEIAASEADTVLSAIRFLKENAFYQDFKRIILDRAIAGVENRIEANMRLLVSDTKGDIKNRILQDQGMLAAFRKFADLDALENLYKVEANNLQERINKF